MRSKLTLPDKDDTSDIAIDQNMFGGILTYAHFNHFNCFISDDFDKHSTTDQQTTKILISLLLGHLSILEHPIARELDLGPSQLEVIPDV